MGCIRRTAPREQSELSLAYVGETQRLEDAHTPLRQCAHFPWWTLWMLWPLLMLLKWSGAFVGAALVWMTTPLLFQVTPLPLLLIGAGLLVVIFANRRGRGKL